MTNEEFIESIKLEGEEWRDVVGCEDCYMVSSFGRVMRKHTSRPRSDGHNTAVTYPKLIKQSIICRRKQKYAYVTMSVSNRQYKMLIHRIVAKTFLNNTYNKPEIDHIDGNGLNNMLSNLRWCSKHENAMNPITRKRQSEARTNKQHPFAWKAVVRIPREGAVSYYESMSAAVKDGYDRSSIIDSIKHPNRPVRKQKWMLLSDYESLVSKSKNT